MQSSGPGYLQPTVSRLTQVNTQRAEGELMVHDGTHAVLLVEDDPDLATAATKVLDRAGYEVALVTTGERAIAHIAMHCPAVVLLDLGLPDLDGLEVCRRVRASGYAGGILVITARTSENDVALSLEAGADDYLPKPFGVAELRARVRALVDPQGRRSVADLSVRSGLRISPALRRVVHEGVEIPLTRIEFDLLVALISHDGELVPHAVLAAQAGLPVDSTSTKVLALALSRLNGKLAVSGVAARVVATNGTGARLDDTST